jgi:hypothetical protein
MTKVNLVLLILWKDEADKNEPHVCDSIFNKLSDMKSEGIKKVQLAEDDVANLVAFAECEENEVNNLLKKIRSIEGIDVVDARKEIPA